MQIERYALDFRKARAVNATDATMTILAAQQAEPSGGGVIDTSKGGGVAIRSLLLLAYALGADNDTFNLSVWGWRPVGTGLARMWVPTFLTQLAATISTAVGLVGGEVLATERFADTLAITTGNADFVDVTSPTGNRIAHAVLELQGFPKHEVLFELGATPPTSMNALVAQF